MYWDLTVFLNFLVDYLLLFAAARLSGTYTVHWRLLAAATLGGVYAGGCLLPGFEFLGALPWRIVFLALMAMLAYGLRRSSWPPERSRESCCCALAFCGLPARFCCGAERDRGSISPLKSPETGQRSA